ncbi:MAG: ATP-dependent helicase HrpB [Actinomycetota bacterium]|nr:ATP-dependent helicase HrpB [Actinomycetota bacterium]
MPSPLTLDPTGLPVEEVVDEVRSALALGGNAVLVAEPGAGKTTVVPLRLADEAWLGGSRIVVLQPRRVVARASARRMATLLGEEVGTTVGYRTGEDRRVGPATRIEMVTEGIMTRQVQSDPELAGIGLVVFDEFHERHLDSDLGLALCLDVQRSLRPDLRLLVMSATIDAGGVASVLSGPGAPPVPVITSRGRLHAVEIRWQPPPPATPVVDTVARVIRSALVDHPTGDVLAFLPGVAEISRVGHALGVDNDPATELRPLHGSLPAAEQDRALAPVGPGRRKVVLCTDLAETSLTVEGVAIVVDAGLARSPRFDPATGLTRLHTGPASVASADQRAGRAGRTGPGIAYRLWAQGEHRSRRRWPDPEITTVDLTGLALELATWGADPATLSWLDPPPPAALARARALLADLGAVSAIGDDRRRLPAVTALGRRMVRLGAHPRLAAIVASAPGADQWLACVLAALVDEPGASRHLTGTADIAEAIRAVSGSDGRDDDHCQRVRQRARRLATRVGTSERRVEASRAGALAARGYPDRLAQNRGGDRLRLRGGSGLRLAAGDPLGKEAFVVVLDTGGAAGWGPPAVGAGADRAVRLAAAIDESDVEAVGGPEVVTRTEVSWDDKRNDLRARRTRSLDSLVLSSVVSAPTPGAETVRALVEVVAQRGLAELTWSDAARAIQHRAVFAHRHDPTVWPDCSDAALLGDLDGWLAPRLSRATARAGLTHVDMTAVLRQRLGPLAGRLDVSVPTSVRLASGRSVTLDYADGVPRLRARAQDLYGTIRHPGVFDSRVPVVVEVLSPAGRPLQVTADLPGFWSGSWAQVRREMLGRYPKHRWPTDPTIPGTR